MAFWPKQPTGIPPVDPSGKFNSRWALFLEKLNLLLDSIINEELTASRLVATDADKRFESVDDLTDWILQTLNRITVADNGNGKVTISIPDTPTLVGLILSGLTASKVVFTDASKGLTSSGTVGVIQGGTGLATLTDHGILLGSGTDPITPLGAATNGQLPIGSTGADPVLAALTQGAGMTITNGAGSISVATHALLGDGTAGRVLRWSYLLIEDGTDAATLKCTLTSQHNGDAIAVTDNIVKNATTGSWTLNAAGTELTIELGDVLGVMASIRSGTAGHYCLYSVSGNDIVIGLRTDVTSLDLTTLADTNSFAIGLVYTTST